MAETKKDYRKIAESVLGDAGRVYPFLLPKLEAKLEEAGMSAFLEGYRAAQEDAGGLEKDGKPLPPVEEAGTSPAASEGDSQIHSGSTLWETFRRSLRAKREAWRWEGRREGLQEGREAGLKEGFEAGRAKGYVDGHADGREEVQRQVAEAFAEGEAAGFEKGGSGLYAEGFEAGRQAHAAEVRAGGGLFAVGFDKGREEGRAEAEKRARKAEHRGAKGESDADRLACARRLLFRARTSAFNLGDWNETYKAINEFLKETAPS